MTEAFKAELVEVNKAGNDITPMELLNLAMEKGADIERMEKLMEMHMRWEQNEARKAFHQARTAFGGEEIRIVKDGHVHFKNKQGALTDYHHETLGQVISQVSEPMSKHGLSHSFDVHQDGSFISVTCRLSHIMGHSETVTMSAPADQSGNKNSIQQIGSTVSYLQRYTLKSILGLASYDDDGRGADTGKDTKEDNREYLADDAFRKFLPTWSEHLRTGKRSVQDIIDAAEGKSCSLTNEQIKTLEAVV